MTILEPIVSESIWAYFIYPIAFLIAICCVAAIVKGIIWIGKTIYAAFMNFITK